MFDLNAISISSHHRSGGGHLLGEVVATFGLVLVVFDALRSPRIETVAFATIRRKLITVPARVASSARRVTLHLPTGWPWETDWSQLFTRVCGPPPAAAT